MHKKPLWAAALLCIFLWGSAVAAPQGQALYEQHCAACHGAGGSGGLGPPLRNSPLWNALGPKASTYMAQVMAAGLTGSIEVLGQSYKGLLMPAQSHISAQELSLIGNYVLGDINGLSQQTQAADIEQARTAPMSHSALRQMRKLRPL